METSQLAHTTPARYKIWGHYPLLSGIDSYVTRHNNRQITVSQFDASDRSLLYKWPANAQSLRIHLLSEQALLD